VRNIKGLLETIEAQRPSDAIPGQVTKTVGFTLYPMTVERVEHLKAVTGINSRSQLFRQIVNFANSHESELIAYLAATNSEVKAG
jgi:hypothetical protein